MIRTLMCLLLVFAASVAEAAPRGRYRTYTPAAQPQKVYGYTSSSAHSHAGHTGSAQGVADMMASRNYMGHFGGNSGYEGVGMGSSPQQALNNCCYSNSGMAVVDQGVSQGSNGKWYACKRYR
jgi:hypothetical protein